MSNISRVDRVNLRDRVAHALRASIISGELEPGVVYSAPSLGARFGISATPVREAMQDLARENLVEIVRNRGFRVTEISEKDLDEITQLRLLIEPPVVRAVTPSIPDEDLSRLRGMAQAIVDWAAAGDLVEYTEADRQFHLELLSYADNTRMRELVSDLRAHTRLYGLASMLERGELEGAAREHLTIVDTIESRDESAVESVMREHISQTRGRWAKPADGGPNPR
ncbi:GntR family transcriptional regulator [Salinifilum ghardaiensis]